MSPNPLGRVAKAVKDALWTVEKVRQLADWFRDRKIAFVQDPEIIQCARELRQTPEWELCQRYLEGETLHILFQLGLTLRELEDSEERRDDLRKKILKKYGTAGLHIAEFVQNGLFSRFIGNILERVTTLAELKSEIKHLFENIEVTNSFIQSTDDVEKEADTIVTRIRSNSPTTYIISGSRTARKKCKEVKDIVTKNISGYKEELYSTEIKEVYFLNKA